MNAVIGVDVGGTSTTAVLYRPGRVERVEAAGANPRSSAASLADALDECFTELARRGARPVAGCIGVAGSEAMMPPVAAAARSAWQAVGWRGEPTVMNDLLLAFRAGSDVDGLLLLSGTGAAACRFEDGRCVRRVDGMGWLLGDVGSGVWLGMEALRAVAADLDGRGAPTLLTELVLIEATDRVGSVLDDPRQQLIAATYSLAPAQCGRFAPLVVACAEQGDGVAAQIVDRASSALVGSARTVMDAHAPTSIVLAGSVLAADSILSHAVRDGLRHAYGVDPAVAHHPVVGAVVTAARRAGLAYDRASVLEALDREMAR